MSCHLVALVLVHNGWCISVTAPGVTAVLHSIRRLCRSEAFAGRKTATGRRTAVCLRQKLCVVVVAKSGCVLRASELFGGLQVVW